MLQEKKESQDRWAVIEVEPVDATSWDMEYGSWKGRERVVIGTVGIFLGLGIVAGILAGLLGIGGGLVIVPMLVFALPMQGIGGEHLMHLALGTSLATIIFTSVSSFLAHHKRGAVRWDVVRRIVLGIFVGTFLGTFLASRLSSDILKAIFVVFLYYVGIQMLSGKKPKPSREIPGAAGIFSMGGVIGMVSSLVGIGGGTLSVPFLVWCNVAIHTAIGTASAIGFPIAIAGTIGFILNGWNVAGLPVGSFGFVYLPALFGIIITSVLAAPLGAKLAHSLPVDRLKKVFSILLFVVGTRMLAGLLG